MVDIQQNDLVRCDMLMEFDNADDIVNSYTLQLVSASTITPIQALDDLLAIMEKIAVILKLIATTLVTFERIRAINLTKNSDIGVRVFATTTAGTVAGDALPLQTAGVITLATDNLSIRGRKFFGGIPESSNSAGGLVGGGAVTQMGNIVTELLAEHVQTNGTWHFGVKSSKDLLFHRFLSGGVSTVYGTRRSRRKGIGS